MRNLLNVLLVLLCISGSALAADQARAPGMVVQEQSIAVESAEKPPTKKLGGYGVFLIVFLVSILFVLSSATALNALGGKKPPSHTKTRPPKTPGAASKLPEGSKRFRL